MSYFQSRFKLDARREKVWGKLTPFFQTLVGDDKKIIELGAGYCYLINGLRGSKKIAIDIFPQLDKFSASDVTPIIESWQWIKNYEDSSFDTILASNFFEHFSYEEGMEILIECFRVLNTNGRLIILQPNFTYSYKKYFDDYTHRAIYTHVGMKDLLSSIGFRTLRIESKFIPYSVKGVGGRFHFLIPIYIRLPIKPLAKQMLIVAEK